MDLDFKTAAGSIGTPTLLSVLMLCTHAKHLADSSSQPNKLILLQAAASYLTALLKSPSRCYYTRKGRQYIGQRLPYTPNLQMIQTVPLR